MKRVVRFHITLGERFYVAESLDVPVVTQGETLDILMKNLQEALSLYFEEEPSNSFEVRKIPAVLVDYELPEIAYA